MIDGLTEEQEVELMKRIDQVFYEMLDGSVQFKKNPLDFLSAEMLRNRLFREFKSGPAIHYRTYKGEPVSFVVFKEIESLHPESRAHLNDPPVPKGKPDQTVRDFLLGYSDAASNAALEDVRNARDGNQNAEPVIRVSDVIKALQEALEAS